MHCKPRKLMHLILTIAIVLIHISAIYTLTIEERLDESEEKVAKLMKSFKEISRQMVLQQLAMDERVRLEGSSGIQQKRLTRGGTMSYMGDSYAGLTVAAMHDHSNNIRTVGLGEFAAVLNGIQFRTRHNDYRLFMPHRTSSEFHAVEEIPFPEVPPEVTAMKKVKNQVEEMRKWFRAWKDQDHSERDYRKYFKAVVCYMEGAWTVYNEKVEESFVSDRHLIDAETWWELEELIRFLVYSGSKHTKENLSFLPKVLINATDDGELIYAQWNYRIPCHPLSFDLPLNRFRTVDDLKSRVTQVLPMRDFIHSKAARFTLSPDNKDPPKGKDFFKDKIGYNWLLEKIMREIPGKDNYLANITDEGYAGVALDTVTKKRLNAGYYHKLYSIGSADASGHKNRHRSYSDENLFMALTTQDGIVGMDNVKCHGKGAECGSKQQKWTYAFPLEIVYLTPLNRWNPYKLEYKGAFSSPLGRTVLNNDADGSEEHPFNGTNSKNYFQTPVELFDGPEVARDAADTSPTEPVHVLDKKGRVRNVTSSGIRMFLPHIKDVGILRQRFPIMPVSAEGSVVWRELDALKKIILHPRSYGFMFNEPFVSSGIGGGGDYNETDIPDRPDVPVIFETGISREKNTLNHMHEMYITEDEYSLMQDGELINVTTTVNNEHSHDLVLMYDKYPEVKCVSKVLYVTCDGQNLCWDRHRKCVTAKKRY